MTDYDDLLKDLDEPIIAVGGGEEEEEDNGIIIGNPEEEDDDDMIIYANTGESRRRKDDDDDDGNDGGYYINEDDDTEYFDNEHYKGMKRVIVPPNPDLPMYKVRITFLDESSSEYTVTEDWTIGNLIASISESIGLLRLADVFFLSEGIRSTLMEPSATNEVWLPLDAPLPACSITPSRLSDPSARPIYFRMRWYRLPACGLTSPAIIHQMYLHVRRSLTSESVRIGVREAGELGGLQLQAALGNFTRGDQHRAGMVASAPPGTYFSEALVAHGDATREELEGLIFQAHERCKGLGPLDAERKYVEDAARCQVPMSGASVFRVKGSTGAERHVGVLRDGLVVDIGTFEGFRFHPYKDVVAVSLGGGGQNENELTVTVRVPVTAGTALGDRTPTETMRFATPEAPAIIDLAYGYMALMGRAGERAVPREKVPPGLPPADLFQEQEPREVLVPYATLVDFFYAMLGSMYEEQRSEPPEHVMCAVEYAHATDSVLDAVSFAPYTGAPPMKPAQLRTLALAVARISNYVDKRGVISNVRITSADFAGCNAAENPEVLPAIKAVCRSQAPLTKVTLRGVGLGQAYGGEVGEAAGSVRTLQELNVAHNPLLGNPGVNALLKGLDKLTGSLARISLADTGISVALLTHITDYLSKHSHVKALSLARNPELCKGAKKHQFAEAVLTMLEKTALTELDITACEVGKADLLKLVTGLPERKSFRKLHIGLNPGVNDKLLNTITSWSESDSMYLSLLDIAGCKVGKKPLAGLLKCVVPSGSYFTDLVLRSVPLHKSLVPHISELGKSKIAHLDLTATGLSDARLVDALAAAVEQSKTLVELRIAGNALPAKSLKGLADAIMGCPTLVTLDVGGCGLKGKEAAAFIGGLKGHKALSVLILDKIKTSDVVYDAITDLVAVDSSPISNLSMKEISFSLKTLNAFLEGLPDSVSLPCLDLRNNKIKPDSLKSIPNVYILL